MYCVCEIEVKINVFTDEVEYVDDNLYGASDSIDSCRATMEEKVNATLAYGYFDKVSYKSDNRIILTNGGSVSKIYSIHSIK